MAVELGKLVSEAKEQIDFDSLSNKRLAVDAYNTIYQFLSIIRQPDGMPLVDSKNRVTSHLAGLFYRTINLLEHKITPIFVFDGMPSHMKQRTIEQRLDRKEKAYEEWQRAKEQGMIEEARMHAMATSRIDKYVVESSKELLRHMGIPYMQAPSEGEAQAAELAKEGVAYAAASQDYDLFLFGSPVVIRNLTITGRRKLPRKNVYIEVKLEEIKLEKLLSELGISQTQLIWLGILIGTDFNLGIEKIGPKTALKIVKENKEPQKIVDYVNEKYQKGFDVDPFEVEKLFLEPNVIKTEKSQIEEAIKDSKPDKNSIIRFMCDEHDFEHDRISKYADKILELKESKGQSSIDSWL